MSSSARESTRGRPSLRVGIFGAEPWGDGMRAEIESAFNIDACDIYGLSEVMGPGVAQEFARTKEGPTIWEDHFIAGDRGSDQRPGGRDGEQGELVFTSLTKEAMPVIRYRTRDLTRLLPGSTTDAAHGQDQRPHRRHADHSRRQRIPVANRGTDPALQGAGARTTRSSSRGRIVSTRSPSSWKPCGTRESRSSGRSAAAGLEVEGQHWHIGPISHGRERLVAALRRQGRPRQGPSLSACFEPLLMALVAGGWLSIARAADPAPPPPAAG